MELFENLEPRNVLDIFGELASIPHGSGNTKQISDYCAKFAEDRGLKYVQDHMNNVVIYKEATAGYEASEPIIIQGHIDMVCEKEEGYDFDFLKDGLKLKVEGDWLTAEGTTLGGDDGIAVAMALAVLDAKDMKHPALEVVLTVDEETGMFGAEALDASILKAKKFINVDSEEEGIFTISCAGGVTAQSSIPVSRKTKDGILCSITINGLRGGHSGMEIDKGRASANELMGRVLYSVTSQMPAFIEHIEGGSKDNVITKQAIATLMVDPGMVAKLKNIVADMESKFAHEYATADPNLKISITEGKKGPVQVLDEVSNQRVIFALFNFPQGIQRMSIDIEGLVETSLNLGILKLEDDVMTASFAVRSSVLSEKYMMMHRLESLSEIVGGSVDYKGEYPGWEYRKESPLRDTLLDVYRKQYGKEPVIAAIHAGLECGLFSEKISNLDCVSVGPDMEHVHTPDERLNIPSVERVWKFLGEVLAQSK